jgi:hypothetical protein
VPRLNEASAEVSRQHEFAADRVAADAAGSRATADALVVIEAGARFAEDAHWPAIEATVETAEEPPGPYSLMLTWNARIGSHEALKALLVRDEAWSFTHPSLRERLARLHEEARVPPTPARSAGDEILGGALLKLAAQLDEDWMSRHCEAWRRERAQYVERRATLDRLAALEAPTADELFMRAELLETVNGADRALPLYQRAAELGHPAASLAAGRIILGRQDATGVALVEAAMERDESLVPEGCKLLAEYYRLTNQQLAARKCEWRATSYTTRVCLAKPEPT